MNKELALKIVRTLTYEFSNASLYVDHDRRGIVYRIECQGARIELPKSLTYQQAMHHAGLFLRELRSAA
jgi:hypothetical protein